MPVPVFGGLALRVEYDYHSKGRAVGVTSLANDNITLVSTSTKQSANSVLAALVYNFSI
jgi:hypothetical protein